jgi:LAS superfamily LD-carboxypeptidase LdcB
MLVVIILGLAAACALLVVQNNSLQEELVIAQTQQASSSALYMQIIALERSHIDAATQQLIDEQLRNGQMQSDFSNQLGVLQGNINQINKTNAIDLQLLQKYSKVFFLNENYVPARLYPIDKQWVQGDKVLVFQTDALPFLTRMLQDANAAGIHLKIISSYRSFGEQSTLKSTYKQTFGTGANTFSADQGYSEHQLGTTLDFTTAELGNNFDSFAKTTAYTWLNDNAWKYGFELSYPKGNAYYVFEPWHWRFVSTALTKHMHDADLTFYTMDQREIDSYRGTFFDQ